MTGATYASLRDKGVLITGGASGIGASIVEHFCAQGSKVAFLDVQESAGQALVRQIDDEGHSPPLFLPCDLTDIAALQAAIARVNSAIGPIQVLVNNAAHDERHGIDAVTPDFWDERFAVNLKHQFFAAQACYPSMKQAGGGAIINMGSVSWMVGQGNMPCYTTAKSAVQGLTRSLARDLGPFNIRVNAVVPGWIMTQRQIDKWLTPEGEGELLARQCLKRKLQPAEIARVVLFFASDEASACTNQHYVVDGGWV